MIRPGGLDSGNAVRLSLPHHANAVRFRLFHFEQLLRFALCAANGRFLFGFGVENHRFLVAFGDEDGRLLLSFREEDLLPLLAFSAHLTFHGILNILGREDVFDFNASNLDAPRIRRSIQNHPDFVIDDVA